MAAKFEGAILDMSQEFLESSSIKHALSRGENLERPIRKFFSKNLPKYFDIVKGEVIDVHNNTSSQLDCIIYDKNKNVKIIARGNCLLPAEAVLSVIEVKAKLTKAEIKKSLIAAKKLSLLKPYNMDISPIRKGGQSAVDKKGRCPYSIFAYSSNLKGDWMKKEYQRLITVAEELGIDHKLIYRIYVINKGLIMTEAKEGIIENENSGKALMFLYLHIFGFLLKENRRRKPAPYLIYARNVKRIKI